MERLSHLTTSFLLNSVWQVSLITAVAAGCALLMRGAPSRYRHVLWVAAFLLCLLAPAIGTLRSVKATVPRPQPSIQALRDQEGGASTGSGNPFLLDDLFRARGGQVSFTRSLALILAGCYLLFVLYRLIRFGLAWRRARAVAYIAFGRGAPESIGPVATECRAAFGLDALPILCSPGIRAPMTLGVAGPVIILPETLLEGASDEMLTSIIGHEMAHVRRRDFLLNLIYELVSVPISFHPAAALMKRRISQTRELACDEMVTERLLSPSVYARSLFTVASRVTGVGRHNYTLGVFDADNLEERIMKLTRKMPNTSARNGKLLLSAASVILALSGLVFSAYSVHTGSIASASRPGQENNPAIAAELRAVVGTWRGGYNVDEMIKAGLVPESGRPKEGDRGFMIIERKMQIKLNVEGEKLTGSFLMHQWLRNLETKDVREMQGEFPLTDPQFDGQTVSFAINPSREDASDKGENTMGLRMAVTGTDTGELWFVNKDGSLPPHAYDTNGKPLRVAMKKDN